MTPEEFAAACIEKFEEAAQRAGRSEQHFSTGPFEIKLCFAGEGMQPRVSPAMAHNHFKGSWNPDLTVYIWDSRSTGTRMAPPPWNRSAFGRRGEIVGYNTENIYTMYHPGDSILRVYDRRRRSAVYWTAEAENIPYWETGFPMREILHWWLIPEPYQLMHAGAVGNPDGGVIIAGKGGSGKSTTCLACLNSDLQYAGDDYILVRTDGEPEVFSLYNTGKVDRDTLERLPFLSKWISNPEMPGDEKALIFLGEYTPEKLISSFPLKAVLVPMVTQNRDTRLCEASPQVGLKALAPTTLMQMPRGHREGMRKLSSLVNSTPNYVLELGTNLDGVVRTLVDFVESQ